MSPTARVLLAAPFTLPAAYWLLLACQWVQDKRRRDALNDCTLPDEEVAR